MSDTNTTQTHATSDATGFIPLLLASLAHVLPRPPKEGLVTVLVRGAQGFPECNLFVQESNGGRASLALKLNLR